MNRRRPRPQESGYQVLWRRIDQLTRENERWEEQVERLRSALADAMKAQESSFVAGMKHAQSIACVQMEDAK